MSPVEWSRLPGEQVEAVLGILLCRKHPLTGNRRRPASGDGGIDLYVVEDDEWDVFQVKGFTEPSLSSGQWKQIEKSWDRFLAFAAENELKVRSWHLVRPQNPTAPEEAKLKEMVGVRDFSCGIRGLDFCDGLAAQFPDVIDYYLHDGADRLERVTSQLLSALTGADKGTLLTAAAVSDRMSAAVLAVRDVDPHFDYVFGVCAGRHEAMPPPADLERAILASATSVTDEATVTVHIMQKYLGALDDRPLPIRLTPKIGPNGEVSAEWAEFFEFGIPVKGMEVEGFEVDLPGGLGAGAVGQPKVTVGPSKFREDQPKDITLTVLDPSGETVASVDLVTEYLSSGPVGAGKATKADDAAGVMTLILKMKPDGNNTFNIKTNLDLTGKAPAEVLPALTVLAALVPPNSFVLGIKHGMRIGTPHAVPMWDEIAEPAEALRRTCRALALIQTRTPQHVVVPDLDQYWEAEADGWADAASIIGRQHVETTWNDLSAERDMDVPLPDDFSSEAGFQLVMVTPLIVLIGGVEVHAGFTRQAIETARLADGQELGDESIRFVPGVSDKVVIDWMASPDEMDT